MKQKKMTFFFLPCYNYQLRLGSYCWTRTLVFSDMCSRC